MACVAAWTTLRTHEPSQAWGQAGPPEWLDPPLSPRLSPPPSQVRLRSRHEDRERRLFEASSKLIVCANGKPVKLSRSKDGGGTWTMTGVRECVSVCGFLCLSVCLCSDAVDEKRAPSLATQP
jgi:hypothetical protein